MGLHTANPWGLYDVASFTELVWDEDKGWDQLSDDFTEWVYAYGHERTCTIEQKTRSIGYNRFYHSSYDFAFRIVLPV